MTRSKHKTPPSEAAGNAQAPAPSSPDAAPEAAGEESAAEPPPPEVSPVAALQQELAACREGHLRLLADFENFRKRMARERVEMAQRAAEALLTDLLPIVDHFELALTKVADPQSPFAVGVRMVFEQLQAALSKAGLQPVDAHASGFDPGLHEAIAYLPSHEVPEGRVVEQTRRGYRIGDRVIRPAAVVVSAGAPAPAPAADAAATPSEPPADTP